MSWYEACTAVEVNPEGTETGGEGECVAAGDASRKRVGRYSKASCVAVDFGAAEGLQSVWFHAQQQGQEERQGQQLDSHPQQKQQQQQVSAAGQIQGPPPCLLMEAGFEGAFSRCVEVTV